MNEAELLNGNKCIIVMEDTNIIRIYPNGTTKVIMTVENAYGKNVCMSGVRI